MLARRFLAIILFTTLLTVAGAFAIYQWGGQVLLRQAIPHGHFEAAKAGGAPDYSQAPSWIARPGIANDPSRWTPDGAPDRHLSQAAVFYIHPTTYLERDRWNAPLHAGGDTEVRTRLFVQSQASAFSPFGDVWAPRYRQAAYGAFLLDTRDAEQALNFAYRDVSAAFDEFLKQAGNRPIILAGHSQGALHLERLLREKVAGKPIANRVVAAYVVGWPIDMRSDLPALGLPACTVADQDRCILSWMTFGDPPNPNIVLDEWEKTSGFDGGRRRQEDMLCVNPITGTLGGKASMNDNSGTLIPNRDMRSATFQTGVVGAHCDKGLLILDGIPPPLGPYVLPGNNYHVYDYALFWGSIRADAERRLAAWRP